MSNPGSDPISVIEAVLFALGLELAVLLTSCTPPSVPASTPTPVVSPVPTPITTVAPGPSVDAGREATEKLDTCGQRLLEIGGQLNANSCARAPKRDVASCRTADELVAQFREQVAECLAIGANLREKAGLLDRIKLDGSMREFERDTSVTMANALLRRDFTWGQEGFGSVAVFNIKVENRSSRYAFKDFVFNAEFIAPSGTKIDHTMIDKPVYEIVPPGKTVKMKYSEFANSQAKTANLTLKAATVEEAPPPSPMVRRRTQ